MIYMHLIESGTPTNCIIPGVHRLKLNINKDHAYAFDENNLARYFWQQFSNLIYYDNYFGDSSSIVNHFNL